ncbi:hypothetical protein AAFC00_006753 [Neodothiora populina]|uniref:Stress response protein ish1 n=1 Tax=Neodothiora populina TaxID=2781224 RepID=A0ABR3PB23_9PEZI
MRFSLATAAVVALASQGVVASTWFGKAAYNKWHETELERWLSDHDVPYPAPADRKDLVDLVKTHWDDKVVQPYNSWDTKQMQSYLASQGQKVKEGTEKNKDSLLSQVKGYWYETAEQASDSYHSVQDWVFDSWTESQLKAFLDYHGIPNPTPRTRDSLLQTARSSYQSTANKIGETAAYPGNWLYESWSDSDLKAWLDERGIPVPQPSSRDKLIASIRRNSRVAANKAATASASISSSAADAKQSLTDALLNSWSDSDIKAWCDKNGIKVPQGSKRNELVALARKHSARLSGDNVASSASSAYGAATTSAGNQYAQATDSVYGQAKQWYDWARVQAGIGGEEAKSSYYSAASVASQSISSASSVASKSASSASSLASKSATSGSSAASKSASSGSNAAAASASSLSKKGGKSAAGYAEAAYDAATEGASSAKHRASEAAQKAGDRVKEEL